LANHFVQDAAARCGGVACCIADEAMQALQAYPWPGNIRQLRNVIERAVALCASQEIRRRANLFPVPI
jgi:NtrC-family two-component system response regulator AlgB